MYINQFEKECTSEERSQIIQEVFKRYPSIIFRDAFKKNAADNEAYITQFSITAVAMRRKSCMRLSARNVWLVAMDKVAQFKAGATPEGVRRNNTGDMAKMAMALFPDELHRAFVVKNVSLLQAV